MSEKYPLLAAEEKCFYLTSPFIEPDGVEHPAEGKVLTVSDLLSARPKHKKWGLGRTPKSKNPGRRNGQAD